MCTTVFTHIILAVAVDTMQKEAKNTDKKNYPEIRLNENKNRN
jgi:hypothetical protein